MILKSKKNLLIIILFFLNFLNSYSMIVPIDPFVDTLLLENSFEDIASELKDQFVKTFPNLVGKERALYEVFNRYYKSLEKVGCSGVGYCLMRVPDHNLGWCNCARGPNYARLYLVFKFLNEVCVKFPSRDMKLVITSFGSGRILTELFCVLGLAVIGYKNILINFIDPVYANIETGVSSSESCESHENVSVLYDSFASMLKQSGVTEFSCKCKFYDDYRAYIRETVNDKELRSHIMFLIDPECGFYTDESIVISGKGFKYVKKIKDRKNPPLLTDLEIVKVDICPVSSPCVSKFFLSLPLGSKGWCTSFFGFDERIGSFLSSLISSVNDIKSRGSESESVFRNRLLMKKLLLSIFPSELYPNSMFLIKKMRNAYKEFEFLVRHSCVDGALVFELASNKPGVKAGEKFEELWYGEFSSGKRVDEWMKDYTDSSLQALAYVGLRFSDLVPFGCFAVDIDRRACVGKAMDDVILHQIMENGELRVLKEAVFSC